MKLFPIGLLKGFVGLLAVVTLLAGCATMDPATDSGATSTSSGAGGTAKASDPELTGSDIIKQGDKLTIEFSDIPGAQAPFVQTVRDDGTITLPLNQKLQAAGKSRGTLADEIYKIYVPKYYRRMTVNIKSEDRFYFVGGEVKSPSRLLYIGEMTVLKAIQSAGDFTDFAQKKKIQLIRSNGEKHTINASKAADNPKLDLPVYPGDTINVPRRLI